MLGCPPSETRLCGLPADRAQVPLTYRFTLGGAQGTFVSVGGGKWALWPAISLKLGKTRWTVVVPLSFLRNDQEVGVVPTPGTDFGQRR